MLCCLPLVPCCLPFVPCCLSDYTHPLIYLTTHPLNLYTEQIAYEKYELRRIIYFYTGPISSSVANALSCRYAIFIGVFLNFLGFFVSSFLNSIEAVVVCYGIIAGIYTFCRFSNSIKLTMSKYEYRIYCPVHVVHVL